MDSGLLQQAPEFLGQLQASWDEISNSVNLLLANPPIITPITPNPLRLKD